MKNLFTIAIALTIILTCNTTFAQNDIDWGEIIGQETDMNPITTAVPFMMIAPDSRSGALGDAGVATSPDAFSQHWNSSKYAFIENKIGFSISYTPWLKKLVDDITLAYLSGYYKLDDKQTVGLGLRYFSMGDINFTDDNGDPLQSFSPHEFAIDGSYNRKLSENFSLGIAARFMLSNLTDGYSASDEPTQAGKSVAIDVNGYYRNDFDLLDYDAKWAFGFNISNIGYKMSYTETEKNFIPTNLRIGGSLTLDIDKYNSITATLDLNKLLVPTPPIYHKFLEGETLPDGSIATEDTELIVAGKDPDVGVATGMIQSFYDAPGIDNLSPFQEEMREITYSAGLEYWYAQQFAVRAGYFHESQYKGNRKYFTAGVGLRMNVFGLDFSYLIPTSATGTSPLSGTWRFSLLFNMASL